MANPTSTCRRFTPQAILPNWQLYFAHTQRWFAAKKKVKTQEQENCVNGVWLYPKPSNTAGVGAPSDVSAWRTPTWNGWWISIFGKMAEFPNLILKYTLSLLRNCTFLFWRLLFTWKIHSSILMVSITTTGNLFSVQSARQLWSFPCSLSLPRMFGRLVLSVIGYTINRFFLQIRRALILPNSHNHKAHPSYPLASTCNAGMKTMVVMMIKGKWEKQNRNMAILVTIF